MGNSRLGRIVTILSAALFSKENQHKCCPSSSQQPRFFQVQVVFLSLLKIWHTLSGSKIGFEWVWPSYNNAMTCSWNAA